MTDAITIDKCTSQPSSEKLLCAGDCDWHRDPQLVTMQRIEEYGALSPKGDF